MDQSFQKKLQALKQEYVASLPAQIVEIKKGIHALCTKTVHPGQFEHYYRLVHSLTGSGATYGFAEVSECSRELEHRLKDLLATDLELNSAVIDVIDNNLLALKKAVEHISMTVLAEDDIQKNDGFEIDQWKILIADDDKFSREQLATMLESEGHTVYRAGNGLEAVHLYETEQPDLIIMDVIMPEMDGLESARQIKSKNKGHFIPIIFLTALKNEDDLVECVRAGGDDFLVKPFNRPILHARIFAMQRIVKLQSELEAYQKSTEEELNLARHVFDAATQRNNKGDHKIEVWTESCGHFSGDVMCYRPGWNNELYVMLGDFTGHGLRAAMGAPPVADIFYEMIDQKAPIRDIALTINRKLKTLLPTGQFLCASFVHLNKAEGYLDVINAGLPSVLLLDESDGVEMVDATTLPLGILKSSSLEVTVKRVSIDKYTRLYLFSDGVLEAANNEKLMFGQEKLMKSLFSTDDLTQSINQLRQDFYNFVGDVVPDDDISIMAMPLV